MQAKQSSKTVRFGPYEADFDEGVLRKHGLPLKIQGKPLAVLQVLVENSGRIVTRDELCRSLWSSDTFVDFDKNLSTAVNKLRDALCDTAGKAQYIETIPRRGYRFRAEIEPAHLAEIEAPGATKKREGFFSPQAWKIFLSAAFERGC
jgi:DNA-binding winged helix-turn-helix (wHTH) protein